VTLVSPRVFDASRPWRLSPDVSIRDEAFGALAYHHGTRRLLFLKSPLIVSLVRDLANHPSATAAIAAHVPTDDAARYERALASLVPSGVLVELV
jgi:putative mycofactocin binding protein MftB